MDKPPVIERTTPIREAVLGFLAIPLVIAFWGGVIWLAVRLFFPHQPSLD